MNTFPEPEVPDVSEIPDDPDEVVKKSTVLAMQLWVKWRDSREAQLAIPKKLIVEILCALDPAHEANIRSGTSKYQEATREEE